VLSRSSIATTAPSDSLLAVRRFPVLPVIDAPAPTTRSGGANEGLPSWQDDCVTVPRPITPEDPSTSAPRPTTSSMAFTTGERVRHPHVSPTATEFTTLAQASLLVADRPLAPLRFDDRPLSRRRKLRYRGPGRLPGPDFHRQAVLPLRLGYVITDPSCHGARASGRTPRHSDGQGWTSLRGFHGGDGHDQDGRVQW